MRAVDTNILVSARRSEAPQHLTALRALNSPATGPEPWALPWPGIYEFLRVVTHPRVFYPPTPIEAASEAVELLLASPSVVPLGEGARHREILAELLRASPVTGTFVHDAHIAALLLEHGVAEIVTGDEDLRRFTRLKIVNPFRA
jgi:toxin-antitoxin system PIN domain toxin